MFDCEDVVTYHFRYAVGQNPRPDLMDFVGTANSMKWRSHPPGTVRIFSINICWNERLNCFEQFVSFIPMSGQPVRKYVDFNSLPPLGRLLQTVAELN